MTVLSQMSDMLSKNVFLERIGSVGRKKIFSYCYYYYYYYYMIDYILIFT